MQSLRNVKILFVDDDINSIHYFHRELIKRGVPQYNIRVVETLDDALDAVRQDVYTFVLIDLYCAPLSSKLTHYKSIVGSSEFVHGQFFGLWLDDHYPNLNYAYVTQIPALLKYVTDKQKEKLVFNKNQLTSSEFADQLLAEFTRLGII